MGIKDLIIKGFTNKLTVEEHDRIESWKNESTENLAALKELQKINSAAESLKGYERFDQDQAWNDLKSKIDYREEKTLKVYKWIQGIAAIIVLGVSAFFLSKQLTSNPNSYPTFTTTDKIESISIDSDAQVILDKNSRLEQIDNRYVKLEGRATFKVNSTPTKDNFIIKIDGGKVVVIGTEFSVLRTDDQLEVKVKEGHVRLEFEGRSIDLKQEDQVILSSQNLAVTKLEKENAFNWMAETLTFKNEPLENVILKASSYFKERIKLDPKLKLSANCRLTSSFDKPSIKEFIDEIKLIFNAEIIKQADSYVITSVKC